MLVSGTRLGPYEILASLGSGGMGEVYRARDSRLGRDVAIKISAEAFNDRFEREARAIASLNHPNVCTLHDIGPNYLVMELVGGETLAERIRRGPIPFEESLRIARQIAEALDAAHSRGIVHRDLKPANVKLTTDGAVKVLDFGLAKLHAAEDVVGVGGAPDLTNLLTASPSATMAGTVLGTAAYMAPEQARGEPVDKRADIWAFALVLYEMLTGARLFRGNTASDMVAAILTSEPDLALAPESIRPLLRRCLTKDPKRRLRDIGDVELLLEDSRRVTGTGPRRSWLPWTAAAFLLVALAAVSAVAFGRLGDAPRAAAAPVRFQIPLDVSVAPSGNIGLSPDGRQLAFLGVGADGLVRLYVRALDSLEVRPLPGSENAAHGPPFFWSPDSRFVAFDAGGVLKKLNVAGGPPDTLCELTAAAIGGTWNAHGDILVGNLAGGILRVSDAGGSATAVTVLDASKKEVSHLLPTFLPDGRHFVYVRVLRDAPESGGVYVGSLDQKAGEQSERKLLPYAPGLTYTPSRDGSIGRLLFVREGTLMAQPFDERLLEVTGEAVPVAEQVGAYLDTAFFSVSNNGVLVYRTSDPAFPITWFDRQGTPLARVSDPGLYESLALSPDGSRLVASRTNPRDRSNADLWLFDLARGGGPTRLTSGMFSSDSPVWSPDGRRIAYRIFGGPALGAFVEKTLDASPDAQRQLWETKMIVIPHSWSPDGRFLLYSAADPISGWDLWVMPVEQGAEVRPVAFAHTKFNEEQGFFSPDGRSVAYVSNESGTNEVYVGAFAKDFGAGSASGGRSVLISKGGGASPRWRRDGRELFYVAPDDRMMAVDIFPGDELREGTPAPLFRTPPNAIIGDASDGKRFLLVQTGAAPFTVVLNWMGK